MSIAQLRHQGSAPGTPMCNKGGGGILGALAGAAAAWYMGPAAFGMKSMGAAALAGAAAGSSIGGTLIDAPAAAKKAASAQEQAQNQAQAQADSAAKSADVANNRANQKSPDTSAILSAAAQAGKGGASGTMLTGTQGIDPAALSLGKNTLLGQ